MDWAAEQGRYTTLETIIRETVFMHPDSARILKNGKLVRLSDAFSWQDGQMYLPVHSAIETMGGTVSRDKKTGQALVRLGRTIVRMSSESSTFYINGTERIG